MVRAELQGGEMMRLIGAVLAMFLLAQCASGGDEPYEVDPSQEALVIIGVAKSARDTSPRYEMLWRRLDEAGGFLELDGGTRFQAETNSGSSVRVEGVPGEFTFVRVPAGVYALDGVFGVIRDGRVDYVAQGVIAGPDRPAFEVGAGDVAYLGIWEADIEETAAVVRPWRLEASDMAAVVNAGGGVVGGEPRLVQTHTRAVACRPHRVGTMTTRQVC